MDIDAAAKEERTITAIVDQLRHKQFWRDYSIFGRLQLKPFIQQIRANAKENGFSCDLINYDLIDLTETYTENVRHLLDAGFPITKPEISAEERAVQDEAREYVARHRRFEDWRHRRPTKREIYKTGTGQRVIVTKNTKTGTTRVKVVSCYLLGSKKC